MRNCIIISVFLISIISGQPLNGTYTIDQASPTSGTNYNTFNDAVNALHTRGVSGAVTFEIKAGTYNEQFVLYSITGASSTNTISFIAIEDVNLVFTATDASNNYIIRLNEAAYIKFLFINFYAYGTNYSRIIDFAIYSYAYNIDFTNNHFFGNSNGIYSELIYAEFTGLENIYFATNYFIGGRSGLQLTTYSGYNVKVQFNYFEGQNSALTLSYFNSPKVVGNIIEGASTSGIYLYSCDFASEVSLNIVTYTGTVENGAGIVLSSCQGTASINGIVKNNFVQNTNVGIYTAFSDYINIYNNSINIDNSPNSERPASRCLQIASGTNINVINNLLRNNRAGMCYEGNTSRVNLSNYNDIYTTGTDCAYWNNTFCATLANLQSVSGKDLNSVSKDVNFISYTNLHLTGTSLGDFSLSGIPLAEVTIDIDGETRNATNPYIGADENIENPLPVELTSFTVKVKNSNVFLFWETKTEINNYGFEVERAVVTEAVERIWLKLGFIAGYGNSYSPKSYQFTDENPWGESKFAYRLKQIDNDGKFEYSDEVEVELLPTNYELYQNYPNPFNPTTTIKYQIPDAGLVILKVYDMLGNKVTELINENKQPGSYIVEFNASDFASGVYIYKLLVNDFISSKKMILIK